MDLIATHAAKAGGRSQPETLGRRRRGHHRTARAEGRAAGAGILLCEEFGVSNRREFLSGAGSLIALSVVASLRQAALAAPAAAAAAPAETTARLDALFEVFMDERLSKSPQQLTSLGLDKDRYAWARAQLNDASLARQQAAKLENASRLKRLVRSAAVHRTGRILPTTTRSSSDADRGAPRRFSTATSCARTW
jgi:hypothetical protein